MKHLLTALLLLTAFQSYAQLPVKWKQTGTWNGFEIVVGQDANNVLLSITNTTLKASISKKLFTSMQVVLDCKQSADYISLAQNFASVVIERDDARIQRDQLKVENDNLAFQNQVLTNQIRAYQAEAAKYMTITIKVDTSAIQKKKN